MPENPKSPTPPSRGPNESKAAEQSTATAGAQAAPLRILIVDDDRVDRLALNRALKRMEREVEITEADTVMTAIETLTGSRFDCVLLDYNLPDGDGLTFLRGLRGAGISTCVIMITGQQDAQVAEDLLKAGAAGYIPKAELTPQALRASLERALASCD